METFFGLNYPTLWFLVIGSLFSGYAILDGFDLGAGAWHLFLRKENSRRVALNAIGPVWDGNEVWLVIGGGALFAGFPVVYATMFSAMYVPFMIFLACIIFRAISIEFRSKEPMKWWRQLWDVIYSLSSIILALLLGVVLGNVLQGVPIGLDLEFDGNWLKFINPYAIIVGITTLALFMMHGAIFLAMKTEDKLFTRVNVLLKRAVIFFAVSLGIATLYTWARIPHMSDDFSNHPVLFILPILVFLSIANISRSVNRQKYVQAFIFSSITVCLLLILVSIELYPVLVFSTIDPAYNITIYNAASSNAALRIMLIITAIGAPLVFAYTFFVYRTFKGKVILDDDTSY